MKKTLSILIVLLINIYTQSAAEDELSISCFQLTQGNVIESINSNGFAKSTYNHIANINCTNPASIQDYKQITIGLSYQTESSIKPAYIANIGYRRKQNSFPQSYGVVVPYWKFHFGFGFSQRFNSILDYEKMKICTIEYPNGTGEYITITDENIMLCYSGMLSYSLNGLIMKNDVLNLGFQLGYNKLNIKKHIYNVVMKTNGNDVTWALGLRYDITEKLKVGIHFEDGASFSDKVKIDYKGNDIIIDYDSLDNGNIEEINIYLRTNSYYLKGKLPDRLNIGLLYIFNSKIKCSFDVTNVYWNQVSKTSMNHVDLSGSITVNLLKHLSVSIGTLSIDRRYKDKYHTSYQFNDKLNGLYLLGGVNVRFKYFDLDCTYVKSTKTSGEWRKQEIGKMAIGVYL